MTTGLSGEAESQGIAEKPYGWNRPPAIPSPALPRPPSMPPPTMDVRPAYVDPRMGPFQPARVAAPVPKTTAAPLVVLISGALLMVGSVTTWLTVSLAGHSLGVSGTDASGASGTLSSVNGWFTFTGGVVLLLLGSLMLVSSDRTIRQLAIVVSFGSLAYALYDLIHILSDISNFNSDTKAILKTGIGATISPSVTVGYGLIVALVAGVAALVASCLAARSS
jgi:hypothetical protein